MMERRAPLAAAQGVSLIRLSTEVQAEYHAWIEALERAGCTVKVRGRRSVAPAAPDGACGCCQQLGMPNPASLTGPPTPPLPLPAVPG